MNVIKIDEKTIIRCNDKGLEEFNNEMRKWLEKQSLKHYKNNLLLKKK